jgi:molecular chaperone DnaK (HSP70)
MDLQMVLEQVWVEAAWAPLLDRSRGVVCELLARAGWTPEGVDLVGLIGGSSLVPAFRRAICELFGRDKLLAAADAELAVAQGATLLTARHRKEQSDQIPILVEM